MAVLHIFYQTAHGTTPGVEAVITNAEGAYNLLEHGNWSGSGFPVLTAEDWTFLGWADPNGRLIIDATGQLINTTQGYEITENLTLTAQWRDEHMYAQLDSIVDVKATFNDDPAVTSDVVINPGDGTPGQTNPEQAYAVYGHIDENASAIIKPDEYYSVYFMVSDENPIIVQVLEGGYVTPPTVSQDGYTLRGWSADPPLWNVFDFDAPITEDTYLWPIWVQNEKVDIELDYNLPEGAVGPAGSLYVDIPVGTWLTIDEDTSTIIGYSLIGWFTEAVGGTQVPNPFYVTGATTLYAHWQAVASQLATVVFYLNYNANVWYTTTVPIGSIITQPGTPERANYTFGGWFTTPSCTAGSAFDATLPVYQNTDVYAKWTAIQPARTDSIYYGAFTNTEIERQIASGTASGFIGPKRVTQGKPYDFYIAIPQSLTEANQKYRFVLTPASYGAINLKNTNSGPWITYYNSEWQGGFYTVRDEWHNPVILNARGGRYFLHRSERPIPRVWRTQITLPIR